MDEYIQCRYAFIEYVEINILFQWFYWRYCLWCEMALKIMLAKKRTQQVAS
jgi:hypothetical protein